MIDPAPGSFSIQHDQGENQYIYHMEEINKVIEKQCPKINVLDHVKCLQQNLTYCRTSPKYCPKNFVPLVTDPHYMVTQG